MRVELLLAVKKSMLVCRVVTPCGLVGRYLRFEEPAVPTRPHGVTTRQINIGLSMLTHVYDSGDSLLLGLCFFSKSVSILCFMDSYNFNSRYSYFPVYRDTPTDGFRPYVTRYLKLK
jgi:hypothetical protein